MNPGRFVHLGEKHDKASGKSLIMHYCKPTPCIERTGTQRRTKVSPLYVYWMHYSWQKRMSWDEAMSNNTEI